MADQTGSEMIAAERERQLAQEGYEAVHDDGHDQGEMVEAAIALLTADDDRWPFCDGWKPDEEPVRALVKAGALIAAEIDRLQRQCPATHLERDVDA